MSTGGGNRANYRLIDLARSRASHVPCSAVHSARFTRRPAAAAFADLT